MYTYNYVYTYNYNVEKKMHTITHTKNVHLLPAHFYLFSFGANDVHNLAKRFFGNKDLSGSCKETTLIRENTTTAFLEGYIRTFFGYSEKWKGSVASISRTQTPRKGVHGLLTEIHRKKKDQFVIQNVPIHFKALCRVEAIDEGMYILQHVANASDDIFVYAFVGCAKRYPASSRPSEAYLEAIGKTVQSSFPGASSIEIPIRYSSSVNDIDEVYVYIV